MWLPSKSGHSAHELPKCGLLLSPERRAPDYSSSISLPIKLTEKQKDRTQCTFWRRPWFRKSRWCKGAGIFTTESFDLQRTGLDTRERGEKTQHLNRNQDGFPSFLLVMSDSKEILPFAFSWVWVEFVFILVHYFFDQTLLMPGVAVLFFFFYHGWGWVREKTWYLFTAVLKKMLTLKVKAKLFLNETLMTACVSK